MRKSKTPLVKIWRLIKPTIKNKHFITTKMLIIRKNYQVNKKIKHSSK